VGIERLEKVHSYFGPQFRKRRMQAFVATFRPSPQTTILDCGGSPHNWELVNCEARITLLNVYPIEEIRWAPWAANISYELGDATNMPYEDGTFDIGFSNSVIEHLGTYENQAKLANEIRRVARKLWVQTPARSFLIEPHLWTPFIHYLPKSWQQRLMRNFTVFGLLTRPSYNQVEEFLREIRLLNFREMQQLFPDCEIRKERFLFFVKSYIAVRK
jgi:hypothetical protein